MKKKKEELVEKYLKDKSINEILEHFDAENKAKG
jgi:hypothetical protein